MKPQSALNVWIFLDRKALWMASALLIQQSLVAASTVLLAGLVGAIHSGSQITPWLLGYLVTLMGPYLPGAIALYLEKAWALRVQWRFAELFSTHWYSKTFYWGDRSAKAANVAVFSKEAPAILDEITTYSYRTLALILNAGLSVIAVSLAIHSTFILSYVLGLLVAGAVVWLQDVQMRKLSESAEKERIQLTQSRMQVWDNLTLGNRYSKDLWFSGIREAHRRFASGTLDLARHSQFFSIAAAWSLLLPTLALLVQLFLRSDASPEARLALVVALPRLFQILNSSYELLLLAMDAGSLRGRWKVLEQAFDLPEAQVESRIQYPKLRLESGDDIQRSFQNIPELLKVLKEYSRITVRGENGTGKSSLCTTLKDYFGDQAFFLPARHELAFSEELTSGSTGQRWVSQLEEILRKKVTPILILDEWDANLDSLNRGKIECLLTEAVENGARVVDVRHSEKTILTT